MSEDHWDPIFQTTTEGPRRRVRKLWRWLTIFQGVAAAVGENLWDRSVFWGNLVGALASDNEDAQDLTDVVGAPTYVADSWLGIASVEIYCSAGAERCGGRKILLAQDRRLLKIFGHSQCQFGVFGLGLTSVEEVDALNLTTG